MVSEVTVAAIEARLHSLSQERRRLEAEVKQRGDNEVRQEYGEIRMGV